MRRYVEKCIRFITQNSEAIVNRHYDDFAVSSQRATVMKVARSPRKAFTVNVNHDGIKAIIIVLRCSWLRIF